MFELCILFVKTEKKHLYQNTPASERFVRPCAPRARLTGMKSQDSFFERCFLQRANATQKIYVS